MEQDGTIRETGSPEPMAGRCGAKIRRSDPPRYCRNPPTPGRTRCLFHGGAPFSGRPPFSPSHEYVGAAATRVRAHYEQILKEPELLSLRREIAWNRAYFREI